MSDPGLGTAWVGEAGPAFAVFGGVLSKTMLYKFKKNGVRAAVRTDLALAEALDGLTFDMLDQVAEPLAAELPMGMRYFFAKYDSNDLKKAYGTIRSLYALEKNDALRETITGAVVHLAGKGPEECRELLVQTVEKLDKSVKAKLCIIGAVPAELVDFVESLGVTVEFAAEARKIQEVDPAGMVADKETVVVTFDENTDLSAQVTRLLDAGLRICAVPAPDLPDDKACAMYDALSRTLMRRYRTDEKRGFTPFALSDHTPGRWLLDGELVEADLNELPGAYLQYGLLLPVVPWIRSPKLLGTLVECAITLVAK